MGQSRLARAVRELVWLNALGAGALMVLGYTGALWAFGDSLAVLRWQLAAAALVLGLAVAAMRWRRGLWLAAAGLAVLAHTGLYWVWPGGGDGALILYQKNLSFEMRNSIALLPDIRSVDPDILTLQEIVPSNAEVLEAMAESLPHQVVCRFERIAAVGIATRLPPVPGETLCREAEGLAGIKVQGPDGPLWLISTHWHWPWPYSQDRQVAAMLPILRALDAPMLIAGDFNMVPWGAALGRFAEATGTRRLGPARNSYPKFSPLAPLPIDHVLVPRGATGRTELRPRFLSDHRGLVARIAWPR